MHDVGELADGRLYFAMKLVRGVTLEQVLDEVRVRTPEAKPFSALLQAFLRICEAVAFAHARGVLHRDLKPQNIMIGEFGEVYVMDWGLFKRGPLERAPYGDPSMGSRTRPRLRHPSRVVLRLRAGAISIRSSALSPARCPT